jgi:branched-chain amino acid transport system substrate-binding protein
MRVKFAYAASVKATVEMLTAGSKKRDDEANHDANVAAGHAAPLMGRIADSGNYNENGARLTAADITTEGQASRGRRHEVSGVRTILTTIKSVQPGVSRSGGTDTTDGRPAQQAAASGIRAKILGGDGVCTDKVGKLAGFAMRNPVRAKAQVALSDENPGMDFKPQAEDRSHTLVQIDAPFAHEALCVIVAAMKRANSFDAPKVLAATPSTGYGVTGGLAIDYKGDLKEGAITLYDFRDSEAAVLDAVEM